MKLKQEMTINGIVNVPEELTAEQFTDALIEWVESKGWTFGGTAGPFVFEPEPSTEQSDSSVSEAGSSSGTPGGTEMPEVIKFLLGEGQLDGKWYGSGVPSGKAPYWWRTELRKLYTRKP